MMLNAIRLFLCIIAGISLFYLLENLIFKSDDLSNFKRIKGQVNYAAIEEYTERVSKGTYYEMKKLALHLKNEKTPIELKGIPQDQLIRIKTSINRGEYIEVFYGERSRGFFKGSDIDVVQINVDDSVVYSLEASKKLTVQAIIQFLAIIAVAIIGLIVTYRSSKLKELINISSR